MKAFGHSSAVTYAIYSGDPLGLFAIDQHTGSITVARDLDADQQRSIMLNVQAANGMPPTYNHTQVCEVMWVMY